MIRRILLSSFLVVLCGVGLALAQVPMFQGTTDYTVTWTTPAAPRTLTIPDPGGNDTFAFVTATQTFTGKSLARPQASGSAVTLGTCTNGALDSPSVDLTGRVTFSGANSTCTINFSSSMGTNAPLCVAQLSGSLTSAGALRATTTTTALTIVSAVAFANTDAVTYECWRR